VREKQLRQRRYFCNFDNLNNVVLTNQQLIFIYLLIYLFIYCIELVVVRDIEKRLNNQRTFVLIF